MAEKKIKKLKRTSKKPSITEGSTKKGGLNKKEKTKRPAPPKGQNPKKPDKQEKKKRKAKKAEYVEVTRKAKQTHIITCTNCATEMEVDLSVKAVLCANCTVIKMIKLYGLPKGCGPKKETGPVKPPGWHFYKEFVDKDGTVYHKGVEQPELLGTMEPTVVKVKKKSKCLSVREKEEISRELFKEIHRNKFALNKLVRSGKSRGQKGLTKKIQKLTREVKKYI